MRKSNVEIREDIGFWGIALALHFPNDAPLCLTLHRPDAPTLSLILPSPIYSLFEYLCES